MARQLHRSDYSVGWVCALPVELAAAQEMLDEEHAELARDPDDNDENLYALGSMAGHNVAIVCLPAGRIGNNPAAAVATQMRATFKGMRFGLMVGIGGGVPSAEADVRLGDVVVSQPDKTFNGVVQYDFSKTTPSGFKRTGALNAPPSTLLSAVAKVRANKMRGRTKMPEYIARLGRISEFQRSEAEPDILFEATYDHAGGQTCDACLTDMQKVRPSRSNKKEVVHYGTIASGNQLMRSARQRDRVSEDLGGVLCFEMEAAGLMNTFPCLVIRGICDYADSHKNKRWQPYAAGVAAAYAKEVLSAIPVADVAKSRPAEEVTGVARKRNSPSPLSPSAKRRKLESAEESEINSAHQPDFTLASRAQTKQPTQVIAELTAEENECLKSLAFKEQDSRFNHVHIAQDTCEWLLEDAQYQAWLRASTGLFWVKGNPGAGKSVLMKHIIKRMRDLQPNALVISFFFHGQGNRLQNSPLGLFRALLSLILEHFPEDLAQLTARFAEKEKRHGSYVAERWEWTENELQELLSDVLTKGTQNQPVVIFVDALDECGEGPAKSLLAYFKDLTHQAEHSSARFKICFSSRHYPILAFDIIPAVHVEKMNREDIQWYTRQRLKDVQPMLKRKQIVTEVLSKADGGFQWVFLVTQTIIDKNLVGIKADKLLKELAYCPQTLSAMYERILNGVSAADQPQMVKIFRWVLFAERPLSAQELRDALAADQDVSHTSILDLRAHEGWSDTLAGFERYVKHISRGMICFRSREIWERYMPDEEDSDLEAQLIHQSVADYLLDKFLGKFSDRSPPSWSQAGVSHFQISRSCLRYMTTEDLLEAAQLPRGVLSSRFPLAPYAVRFLFVHIQKAEEEGVLQSDLLFALQWAPKSSRMRKAAILWRTLDPDSAHTPLGWPFAETTALHVLVAFGSLSAVGIFLESNGDTIDSRDTSKNTPLMLAIREGHQKIALALLEKFIESKRGHIGHMVDSERNATARLQGTNLNAQNTDGDTALDIALDHKMDEVILRLIKAGADLKYLGRAKALVAYAISTRNMKLLSMAIENKLDLDGAVFFALKDRTSEQDHVLKSIISQLLKAGASTARSSEYQSSADLDLEEYQSDEDEEVHDNDALMIAARRGRTDIVSLLLSYGTLGNAQNDLGQCPLLIATENGHEKILPYLLRNDPSAVETADEEGRTALHVARESGNLDVVNVLVEMGKFSTSEMLEEIFLDAARDGSITLVKTILQKVGVSPDSKDPDGLTVPARAVENGREAVVKLLLDTGRVDVDLKDQSGRTPLSLAAGEGHDVVVKLLLNTGKVNVNLKDQSGRTPLSLAAGEGHEAVVKLLLEIGKVVINIGKVVINSKDQERRTPLSWAARNGHEAVVKLLLDTDKVNVDLKDQSGRTPLSLAAGEGHDVVVKLLLDTGKVNIDLKDQSGRTPLSLAAGEGHEAVVKLLLNTDKVDIDSKDQEGRTPLLWATCYRYEAVAKLLLDTGKVNVDVKDQDGRTLLLLAARNGHEAVVKLLLGTGNFDVNVDSKDQSGWTPLSLAAQNGHEAVVKLLLGTGNFDVNVDSKDQSGWTPLSLAAQNGHEAVVKLLLDTGKVDVNSKDQEGRTPLLLVALKGHEAVAKLLLDPGNVDVDVDSKDQHGWTPLLWATWNGQEAVVKLLLDTGKVDVNSKDQNGRTALAWAADNGHKEIVYLLLNTDKVDVDSKDRIGDTPLTCAAWKGHMEVAKLLLDTGKADINSKNRNGSSTIAWAAANGHRAMNKLLLDTGKVEESGKREAATMAGMVRI